ncbi:acyltransferase domain-containing protein [Candidatus Woesearchaeota archaeon]|nr:acyltransferase domain-containing protein [Candidatus Woesearchaeota archaeon]
MAETTADLPEEGLNPPKKEDIKSIGVLFPGQGNQYRGMGRALCEQYPSALERYKTAARILGNGRRQPLPLENLFLEGPADPLMTFLATVIYSVVLYETRVELEEEEGLEPKISNPAFFAGMSAGEASALYAARAMEFNDFVALCRHRGRNVIKKSYDGKCMLKLANIEDAAELDDVCKKVGAEFGLWNAPDTIVLTAEPEEIQAANKTIIDMGRSNWKPKELNINIPYHSSKLKGIAEKWWRKALNYFHIMRRLRKPQIPVIANATAEPYAEDADAPELLEKQFYTTVLWYHSMMKFVFGRDAKGNPLANQHTVDAVVELGPKIRPNRPGGGSLSSLLSRFPYKKPVLHLTSEAQLRNVKFAY